MFMTLNKVCSRYISVCVTLVIYTKRVFVQVALDVQLDDIVVCLHEAQVGLYRVHGCFQAAG